MADEKTTPDRGDEVTQTPAPETTKPAVTVDTEVPEGSTEAPEGETEGEETPDEKAEREAAEAKAEREKRIRIPKARFDEAMDKARMREEQLLAQIQQLQAKQPQKPVEDVTTKIEAEIDTLQEKYESALIDGKSTEAKELRVKIKGMQNQLFEHKTAVLAENTRLETMEELQYNATLANIEATHPELNPESGVFNAALTDEISQLMQALMATGTPRIQALARATKYVIPTSRPTGSPATPANQTAEARAVAARAKAAAVVKQQPAALSGVGADADKAGVLSGKVDVSRMSLTQFAKLSKEELSRLRGDEA